MYASKKTYNQLQDSEVFWEALCVKLGIHEVPEDEFQAILAMPYFPRTFQPSPDYVSDSDGFWKKRFRKNMSLERDLEISGVGKLLNKLDRSVHGCSLS